MTDPTSLDPVARWTAWLHPAWMVATIAAAGLGLRAGLALRRARLLGVARDARDLHRHLRWARPAVGLAVPGFAAGLLSMWMLRDRVPFGTVHAALATLALALFLATATLGWRLQRRRATARDAHALAGLAAVLAAALSAVAGFVLLP